MKLRLVIERSCRLIEDEDWLIEQEHSSKCKSLFLPF